MLLLSNKFQVIRITTGGEVYPSLTISGPKPKIAIDLQPDIIASKDLKPISREISYSHLDTIPKIEIAIDLKPDIIVSKDLKPIPRG